MPPVHQPESGRSADGCQAPWAFLVLVLASTRTRVGGSGPYPVVTVGKVPPIVGQPLLAGVTPQAARHRLGLPCTMGIYLKTGADAYTAYGPSGGP